MTFLLRTFTILVASLSPLAVAQAGNERPRAREAGIVVGVFPTGAANAITDVAQPTLTRLARRALFGLARTGSSMSNGSGDYVIAFSTAESVRRRAGARSHAVTELSNDAMTPLFQAVAEATEEAIYNSLFKATTTSFGDTTVEALPLDRTLAALRKYGAVQ